MAQRFSSGLIMNTITIIIMINNNILKDGLTTHELFWSRSLLIQFSTSWQKDLLLKYLQVIQKQQIQIFFQFIHSCSYAPLTLIPTPSLFGKYPTTTSVGVITALCFNPSTYLQLYKDMQAAKLFSFFLVLMCVEIFITLLCIFQNQSAALTL